MSRAVLCFALLFAGTVFAEERIVLKQAPKGVFVGESWRYRSSNLLGDLLVRTAADLVAIPSGMPWWGAGEWTAFTAVVGSTVGLSVGRPSLDIAFHQLLQEGFLSGNDFAIWGMTGDLVIWGLVGAATVGLLVGGLVKKNDRATQTAVLMIEAFAVAQLYHNVIKLLSGRAGPKRPELEGYYFGPSEGYKLWPEGTPSGHMASMYAMLSVLMYSIDHPAVWVGLNLFALCFGAALVGDDYHWVSDVILGGAMGFAVGRWVVRHRSSWYVYGEGEEPVTVSLVPMILPGSGGGVGLAGRF